MVFFSDITHELSLLLDLMNHLGVSSCGIDTLLSRKLTVTAQARFLLSHCACCRQTPTGTNELSTIETSITLYNKDLLKEITHETVMCWMRVMLSNALAYDGEDWTKLFALHNSGTYNNGK